MRARSRRSGDEMDDSLIERLQAAEAFVDDARRECVMEQPGYEGRALKIIRDAQEYLDEIASELDIARVTPATLTDKARRLAKSVEPWAAAVYCSEPDYVASGLALWGPITRLALRPPVTMSFTPPEDPGERSVHMVDLYPERGQLVGTISLERPR